MKRFGCALILAFVLAGSYDASAQFERKWLSAGDLHNWYSAIGVEVESQGFVGDQQDGLRWPGIYNFRDTQAAKGLWIGARNVPDASGASFPVRVVHAGPRVTGLGEFFPVEFTMTSRFTPPLVLADGEITEPGANMTNDEIDPDQAADREIYNEVNTLLGITMQRRILQFSQDYHDDYHIIEYTFINTGNTDSDPEIEVTGATLEDVMFFYQYRLSVAKETRYVIGNSTGWGINAMVDARGDGVREDPADEDFRAQFVWHGNFPAFTAYDNIGGPILPAALPAQQVTVGDTLGRLGAHQFSGVVTIHADTAPGDATDDPSQPRTTRWFDSDANFTSNNDPFNEAKMQSEYGVMTAGHQSRHAYTVEPSGMPGWLSPTGDPALGGSGGPSFANGYGPYTMAPGDTVRLVLAEAVGGLSRDVATKVGRAWKQAGAEPNAPITVDVPGKGVQTMTKNEWVFTSRDSLFQTFRRAIANYESGYAIARPPLPPVEFTAVGGGDGIFLNWTAQAGAEEPDRWDVYRARGRADSTYTRIGSLPPGSRDLTDLDPVRGVDYFYYVTAVKEGAGDGVALTPSGVDLASSRYYTQTYTPVQLKRQSFSPFDAQGAELPSALDSIRIVPNPFIIGGARPGGSNGVGVGSRFDRTDKLDFYELPLEATIEIFTEMGEFVDRIDHSGSGDATWNHTTSSRQVVVSGVYIAVITDETQTVTNRATGEVVNNPNFGRRVFKKFVIIR